MNRERKYVSKMFRGKYKTRLYRSKTITAIKGKRNVEKLKNGLYTVCYSYDCIRHVVGFRYGGDHFKIFPKRKAMYGLRKYTLTLDQLLFFTRVYEYYGYLRNLVYCPLFLRAILHTGAEIAPIYTNDFKLLYIKKIMEKVRWVNGKVIGPPGIMPLVEHYNQM
jgi:hypothetical protein